MHLNEPSKTHYNRELFFANLDKIDFKKVANKYLILKHPKIYDRW